MAARSGRRVLGGAKPIMVVMVGTRSNFAYLLGPLVVRLGIDVAAQKWPATDRADSSITISAFTGLFLYTFPKISSYLQ